MSHCYLVLFGKAALLLLLDLSIFPVITGVAHLVSRSSAANVSVLTTLYSTATFQCPLQGDLVFKLNPGPTDHQSTIHTHVTHHRAPLSSRTRNYSNLITVNRAPLAKHSNTPVYKASRQRHPRSEFLW